MDIKELKEHIKNEKSMAMAIYKKSFNPVQKNILDGMIQAFEEILQYIEDNE